MLTPNSLGAHKNKWSINDIESQIDFEILHTAQKHGVSIQLTHKPLAISEKMISAIEIVARDRGWLCTFYCSEGYTVISLKPIPKPPQQE